MKLLLLGADGQVGTALRRALAPLGELVALGRAGADGLRGDLTDPDAIRATIQTCAPDIIINAAAYTAVDRAESEPALAHAVNAVAPGVLAEEARALDAWLVHYSTDYVFDGSGAQPWSEDDATGPLNVYGASKLAGEQAVRDAGARHLIFRTSWVYAATGSNFLRTMLRLARDRDGLQVVDDQIGAPTSAELIADVTAYAIRRVTAADGAERGAALHSDGASSGAPRGLPPSGAAAGTLAVLADGSGTYHLVPRGETSWFDYARHLIAVARESGHTVRVAQDAIWPVPSTMFPTAAQRPHNSRLAVDRLELTFALRMPDWESGVTATVRQILASPLG